eukprot:1681566-Prymnesium_polylepis.1
MSRSEALERPWLPVGWKRGTLACWPPPTRTYCTSIVQLFAAAQHPEAGAFVWKHTGHCTHRPQRTSSSTAHIGYRPRIPDTVRGGALEIGYGNPVTGFELNFSPIFRKWTDRRRQRRR